VLREDVLGETPAAARQDHRGRSPVVTIGLAANQPAAFECVQPSREPSAGDDQSAAELARSQAVGTAGATERGEDIELATGDAVRGKHGFELFLQEHGQARDSTDDSERGPVKLRQFASPLREHMIDVVAALHRAAQFILQKSYRAS
jgi:hypothetical protein